MWRSWQRTCFGSRGSRVRVAVPRLFYNCKHMERRDFLKSAAVAGTAVALCGCDALAGKRFPAAPVLAADPSLKTITIASARCEFERKPLLRPFGFKGGYLSELWNVYALLTSEGGNFSIGQGVQSCLWSDAAVFSSNSEAGGNSIMFAMTQYALKLAEGKSFRTPVELNDWLFPQVWEYGKKVAADPKLRATFALNALVPVDSAAWVLYARENGFTSFDGMIPADLRAGVPDHHAMCASIPLISYAVPIPEVREAAESGYFFLKIKIGHAGTQEEMLEKDCRRISEIHEALKDIRTPHTESGKVQYYFDANGRYETKETFLRFADHLDKIGAMDQVAIVEEPFDEYAKIDVHDIPVRLAADESAHTVEDAEERIRMGYRAMALKPIAKTMSMSLKIAKAAFEKGVPCFCADLTVNPVMVEWNKAVASRLPAFPGLGNLGLVESNGHQNYVDWEQMREDLAWPDAPWTRTRNGVFELDDDYWARSGGILEPLPRLEKLLRVEL